MAARNKPAGQTQVERDRISLGRIEAYMDAVLKGEFQCPTCKEKAQIKEISSGAVALIKARYDKLRPSLSAVEQTNVNPDDKLGDADILAKFQQLIEAHPDVLQQLIAMQARADPGPKSVGAAQQKS